MQISITSWSFNACNLSESWAITQALGIQYMDLGLLHGSALDRELILSDPETAAEQIQDKGISVSNLYWMFGDNPYERPVSQLSSMAKNTQDLSAVLKFSEILEIPTLFLLPGVSEPKVPTSVLSKQSARSLSHMVSMAQSHGIILSVEPHVGSLLSSPKLCLDLLEQVPDLKLTLDYAHFVCMGYVQSEIDLLAEHAAHVHMRQAKPGALQTKMSEGTLDFIAMVETLRKVNYKGYLSIEYVHQAYMDTIYDDVLTETILMRDTLRRAI